MPTKSPASASNSKTSASKSKASNLKSKTAQNPQIIDWFEKYLRYTNYLGAAQLYLKDNFLLEKELKPEHMKFRVLGHWGSVPGLNFAYAHLNYLISKKKAEMIFVCGPGHGAPAVIANLFAEGSLADNYPQLNPDAKGTGKLLKMFSWPGGFPSHTNPGTPGSILEGGELGYSLATSFGSVMDNPDLITACICGDGEAESCPLQGAWNSNKYLNPKTSGAVLPIILINGYKITSPTISSTMSDEELIKLYSGFGYQVRVVNHTHPKKEDHIKMMETLEWAYNEIRAIQKKARTSKTPLLKPAWPAIMLRTLKGETGIQYLHGEKVEGTYRSHGIPCQPGHCKEDFPAIKKWLESYKIQELVDKKGRPLPEVIKFVPTGQYRMGANKHTNPDKKIRKELILPNPKKYEVKTSRINPKAFLSNAALLSDYTRDIFKLNSRAKNFRFMCPDETESNKFQSLFQVTKRAYMWPLRDYDTNLDPEGRVMETLSEHNLMGWLQGYLLTGRHGIFVTYEAFAMIIASMIDQYAKFIKQAMRVKWRKPVSSLNILLTSIGWRQEHNGFSHQNPGFISNIIEKHGSFCSAYFPADANQLLVVSEDCYKRTNSVNVIVASKQLMPQWITIAEAKKELKTGIGLWEWINPAHAKNPDVVFAATGDVMVFESMAAISLLKKEIPEFKIRFLNISELTALGLGDEKCPLSKSNKDFEKYFTSNRPIIYNFHGYIGVIQSLIFGHQAADRFSIHGYKEEGTTTTPFEMHILNETSRYHLAIDALEKASSSNSAVAKKAPAIINKFKKIIADHEKYIRAEGRDGEEIENWHW